MEAIKKVQWVCGCSTWIIICTTHPLTHFKLWEEKSDVHLIMNSDYVNVTFKRKLLSMAKFTAPNHSDVSTGL